MQGLLPDHDEILTTSRSNAGLWGWTLSFSSTSLDIWQKTSINPHSFVQYLKPTSVPAQHEDGSFVFGQE
eukprot:4432326-Amphidinium_carterae.1